jgi:spore coat protein H
MVGITSLGLGSALAGLMTTGALLLGAASADAAVGRREPRIDASDEFFTNGPIPTLRIEINKTNLAALHRNDRAYVRAVVKEGSTVYTNVGIHNKGAAGSRRDINDNPALTLNFDKFEDKQRFHALDKIHLNNSVQDPSFMTEILCGDLFRAAGVPAPRGTHARVFLNGRDLGLYVLKEGFDKTFLRRYFKNASGNLYDGGFLREIDQPLERTSGDNDVKNFADLKAVFAAAMERDPNRRMERLEAVLDLDRFISFLAMEIMTYHWDGYALKRNNYRVYHDPDSGKAVFFPHGMDQMFWDSRFTLHPNFEGMVAQQLIAAPEGKRRYRERIAELTTSVFRAEWLTNRIHQLQARIRPELAKISLDAARSHDGAVENLRNQVVARARFLEDETSRPEAKPLRFDARGCAPLTDWSPIKLKDKEGKATLSTLDMATEPGGRRTLHIATGPDDRCIDAWRTRLILPPGRYRFEARIRTAGVKLLPEDLKDGQVLKGEGAGIRMSRAKLTRPNRLLGNTAWQQVEYDFEVPNPPHEIELVCELRAEGGEAWFDLDSLRLKRN